MASSHQTSNKRINTKESVIDLSHYIDKPIRVFFVGGRNVQGILKGADPICNLVLDETIEFLERGKQRTLGIMIARGTSVQSICQADGFQEMLENPYADLP